MKLVIDIPEEMYRKAKDGTLQLIDLPVLSFAIETGTPYEENTCDEREKGNCPFYTARGDV